MKRLIFIDLKEKYWGSIHKTIDIFSLFLSNYAPLIPVVRASFTSEYEWRVEIQTENFQMCLSVCEFFVGGATGSKVRCDHYS